MPSFLWRCHENAPFVQSCSQTTTSTLDPEEAPFVMIRFHLLSCTGPLLLMDLLETSTHPFCVSW